MDPSREQHAKQIVRRVIVLNLLSSIHVVMKDQDLYRSKTMKHLIQTLDKLKRQDINGHCILFPVTKEQKVIFDAFGVQPPVQVYIKPGFWA